MRFNFRTAANAGLLATLLQASTVSAQQALIWGEGTWGSNTWSSDNSNLTLNITEPNLYWGLSSTSFSGTINNGVLAAGSKISLNIANKTNKSIDVIKLTVFAVNSDESETQIGFTDDPNVLGNDGVLDPGESLGVALTLNNLAFPFPFRWELHFVDPQDGETRSFSTYLALVADYQSGVVIISASGSTGGAVIVDSDLDGVSDSEDSYPFDPSKFEEGSNDNDGSGGSENDVSLVDTDGDGYADQLEVNLGTDPNNVAEFPHSSRIVRTIVETLINNK